MHVQESGADSLPANGASMIIRCKARCVDGLMPLHDIIACKVQDVLHCPSIEGRCML